jgi:hypothetical protein
MIDVTAISKMAISPEVKSFMDVYGGSHVTLYQGWQSEPHMCKSPAVLEEQLSYAIREGRDLMARRILSKIRTLNRDAEDEALTDVFFGPKDPDCLL